MCPFFYIVGGLNDRGQYGSFEPSVQILLDALGTFNGDPIEG